MSATRTYSAVILALSLIGATGAVAQDWYDPNVLRTVNISFVQSNWETLLRNNYASETDLAGTVEVDGVTYPNVGIRIRGNTSYTGLPSGSQKFSLKLQMDFQDPNQQLMGYDTINLNNGWRDPTFTREVEFNNFLALYVPNSRANNVLVTINGQNWGVYNNVQQTDKRLLRTYFSNADGVRIRCANVPNGPGLAYAGTNPASYSTYEIQDTSGLTQADAVTSLINLTNTLSNGALSNMPAIDRAFAIDPSIWTVVFENMLTDDDSYVNKGCDFMTYRDPNDLRTHLIQRDANETWTQTNWAINRNFNQTNKPVLNRLLSVPEYRQRYMAHYRTAKRDLTWTNYFQSRFEARRALIASAVAADTKRIYTLANFNDGFGSGTITLTNNLNGQPATGLPGGAIPGIRQFIDGREAFLNNATTNPELAVTGPTITSAQASNSTPSPSTPVFITASVQAAGAPITRVELFYRPNVTTIYERTEMRDDGASGDGAAGDGVYGVRLPITATPGQEVSYYVMATASNTFASLSFFPVLAERGPLRVSYGLGGTQTIQLTEWMYSGNHGEFVEFTNRSQQAIDLTGWVLKDDQIALPGFSLSSLGTLQPGESFVVTDSIAANFRTAWNLAANTKVLGELGAIGVGGENYGRNDQIHLYDSGGVLIDRLFYGDQTYPGTIRAQNISAQAPCSAFGQNTISSWVLSILGDAYGSVQSQPTVTNLRDIGSPGSFVEGNCTVTSDALFANGFE